MGQYSIIAILLVMLVGREFFGMPEIEASYPLITSLLVFSLSYIVLRWYASREGEL
jgi:hypothetical protein